MKKSMRRVEAAGLACVLAAGLAVGASAFAATPALAANGPCTDVAIAQPTAVHWTTSEASQTVKFLNDGSIVTGPCDYINNTSENHWYMRVNYTGPNNNNGYGYIWVQRLYWGSVHQCDFDGTIYNIPSSACHLS
jgi:hypothetical protein